MKKNVRLAALFAVSAFLAGIAAFTGCKTDTEVIEVIKEVEAEVTKEAEGETADLDNVTIDGTEYQKTSMVAVTERYVTITGDGSSRVFIKDRDITLSPYEIGKYEVTWELFETVMGTKIYYNGYNGYGDTAEGETQNLRPIQNENWYQAITFCNKLTLLTGGDADDLCYSVTVDGAEVDWAGLAYIDIPRMSNDDWNAATVDLEKTGYRLPTEAEWEFAARGGDQNSDAWSYIYAGSDIASTVAWWEGNSDDKTHEVGLKAANSLGIYDMSGNVSERCWDWYSSSISTWDETDPTGASSGSYRVLRGGSSDSSRDCLKVFYRAYATPNGVYYYYNGGRSSSGFRLARSLL